MDVRVLLLAQVAVTWFLCGLIAVIQGVHYPLFALVGKDAFAAYEAQHTALIAVVVVPAMLLEAALVAWLLVASPAALPVWQPWFGVVLLAVVWLSTVLLQVPQHAVLSAGFDANAHRFLLQSNWVRTSAWLARGVLVLWMLWPVLAKP